jgi:hypothetical protein
VIEPVEIEVLRACHFKAKPLICREKGCGAERARKDKKAPCPACGSDRKPIQRQGCARCEAGKHDPSHYGAPPSLNVLGSGDVFTFQRIKEEWTALLALRLEASGLPRGLGRVVAEGEATFPDPRRRDQGNFRVLLEKALGDVLVNGCEAEGIAGGWLKDDDWTRYEFGGLAYAHEPGVSRTRLMLFPAPVVPAPDAQASLAV